MQMQQVYQQNLRILCLYYEGLVLRIYVKKKNGKRRYNCDFFSLVFLPLSAPSSKSKTLHNVRGERCLSL